MTQLPFQCGPCPTSTPILSPTEVSGERFSDYGVVNDYHSRDSGFYKFILNGPTVFPSPCFHKVGLPYWSLLTLSRQSTPTSYTTSPFPTFYFVPCLPSNIRYVFWNIGCKVFVVREGSGVYGI